MQNKFSNLDECELETVDDALNEYVKNHKAYCHEAKLALIKELKKTEAHKVSTDTLFDYQMLILEVRVAEALSQEVEQAWDEMNKKHDIETDELDIYSLKVNSKN